MRVIRLVEQVDNNCPTCNEKLVDGDCPNCNKQLDEEMLNEGPIWDKVKDTTAKLFKRGKYEVDKEEQKELGDLKKVMDKEDTLVGKRWSYYVGGKKVSHNDYLKLDEVSKKNAIVVDENGYFVRKGTQVLDGQKQIASRDIASGNLKGNSAKVDAKHQGTESYSGKPTNWSYVHNGEKLSLPEFEKLSDADKAKVMIVDVKGKEFSYNQLKPILNRFNARLADAEHKQDVADANQAATDAIKKVNPNQGTTITFEKRDGSGKAEVSYSAKEFKKLPRSQQKELVAVYQSGSMKKEFSYSDLKKIPKLAKYLKLESVMDKPTDDDVLTESFTPSKKGMKYDDDFDGYQADLEYEFGNNIDDDFG